MGVGQSDDVDPGDAVAEALAVARIGLDDAEPDAALVFTAANTEHDVVLEAVAEGDDELDQILGVLERSDVMRPHLTSVRQKDFNRYPAIPLSEIGRSGIADALIDAVAPFLPVEH